MLHPVDHPAFLLFLNGDVRHGCGSRGPVPVLFDGREPNDSAGPDLLDGSTFSLHPAAAGRDYERLTERMRVPGSSRARLEGHAGTAHERRIRCLKQRIDSYRAGEPIAPSS